MHIPFLSDTLSLLSYATSHKESIYVYLITVLRPYFMNCEKSLNYVEETIQLLYLNLTLIR